MTGPSDDEPDVIADDSVAEAPGADTTGEPEKPVSDKLDLGDHKAPGAFRTIGEVARALGIRQHVLRYWEEQFPMLSPVKRSGNRRLYRPQDVQLIETIDRLVHREGYTLRGARLALEAQAGVAPAEPPESAASILAELLAIRATLAAAVE